MRSLPPFRLSTRGIVLLTALLLAGAGFGCDGGPTAPGGGEPTPARVARVELSRGDLTLGARDSLQVQAIARGAGGEALAGRAIEWSSSNLAVAGVSPNGMVRAFAPGAAVIAATSEGERASLILTVLPAPAAKVVLSPGTGATRVASSFVFTVAVLDGSGAPVASPLLSAIAADSSVAGISFVLPEGRVVVRGVREGSTTITVRAHNAPGLTPVVVESSASITVGPEGIGRIELTPAAVSVVARDSVMLTAATFAGSGRPLTGRTVNWLSADPAVATVSPSGWVRGVAPGTATIIAYAEERLDSSTVTVTPAASPAPTMEIQPARPTLLPGQQQQLTAVFDPPVVPQPTLTWGSNNSYVATISPTGVVTAHNPGMTTITVAGGGLSSYTLLTVGDVPVGRIAVALERTTITVPYTTRALVTLYDSAGQQLLPRVLTLSSSDPTIATVADDGTVTAVSPGTVRISATAGTITGSATLTVLPADGSPPEVLGLTFAPTQVDVTDAAATVLASVRLRDAGSGIDSSGTFISIATARGHASCIARTLASGTRNDGTWTCTIRIPQGAPPGQWTPSGLIAHDFAFNAANLSWDEAARLSPGVTVTNANADVTPPAITSVTFSPATVDITGHAATTTITVAASDAGGVAAERSNDYVEIESPAGETASCFVRTLVSGTSRDGRWSCTVSIPEWSRVGSWVVRSVAISDTAGNVRLLEGDAARNVSTPLTVTGPAPDVTPPTLMSITLAPTTVQKGTAGATVTVTFTATDDLRGLDDQQSTVVLRSPSTLDIRWCGVPQLVSGTTTNGTWHCTIPIDVSAELGTWTLDRVTLVDIVGNKREVWGSAAQALFPNGITVQP